MSNVTATTGASASPRGGGLRKTGRTSRTAVADDARRMALVVAAAALDKKALAVEILDVVGKVDYADFLVLMTGRSNRHVDSLPRPSKRPAPTKSGGRFRSRAAHPGRGFCSTSATSWFTSFRKRPVGSTTSRVYGSMPSVCRLPGQNS